MGSFEPRHEGQPITGFAQARLKSLLAYLLLHRNAPVSRQQLAFAFWADTTDEQARSNLRTLLHRLREALPDGERALEFDRHTVRWRPDAPVALDVAEFEAVLARAQMAGQTGNQDVERQSLREAVEAYTATCCQTATTTGSFLFESG